MRTFALLVIVLGAIPATLIPLVYAGRPWRHSQAGRALLVLSVGLALLYDVTLLNRVENYPGQMVVAVIVIGIVTVGLWWLLVAILRGRRIRR